MKCESHRLGAAKASGQRGVVLIVALVVLVVMSLAGILMFRATGGGVEVAGNIGMKQNATSLGDLGVEAARGFLVGQKTAIPLNSDIPANGYYATWNETFNPTSYDWETGAKEVTMNDGTGNRVRYVIHRLCKVVGGTTAPGQQCAIPSVGTALGTGGGIGSGPLLPPGQPYYRITSRVDGPRNTVSYVQVIMF